MTILNPMEAALGQLTPVELKRLRTMAAEQPDQAVKAIRESLCRALEAPVTAKKAREYINYLAKHAGNGRQAPRAVSQAVRHVTDGSTNETLSEALGLVQTEILSISTTLFLTDVAIGARDGWDLEKVVELAQCQLTDLRERLSVAAEELERLAGIASDLENSAGANA